MLYALIDIVPNTIREYREFVTSPPDVSRKGIKWLPVEVTNPVFDPATQVRSGPVITVLADRVTRVWTVRTKTAQELDAEKTSWVDGMEFLVFELAFDHENRIRVLEAKAPITKVQFKAALKARLQ